MKKTGTEKRVNDRWTPMNGYGNTLRGREPRPEGELTTSYAKLASQARHEMGAQTGGWLARSVVATQFPKREGGSPTDEERKDTDTEETLNRKRSKRRGEFAAKERGECKGLEIPSARCGPETGGGGKTNRHFPPFPTCFDASR